MRSSKWQQQQEDQHETYYGQQQLDNDAYRQADSGEQHYQNEKQRQKFKEDGSLIPNPRFRQQSKYMTAHTDKDSRKKDNSSRKHITNENQQLKIKNQELKKQLFKFSKRLDIELSKRSQKAQMKNQLLNNMELQNAYQRCEIYKRQLNILKKRDLSYSEDKFNQIKGQLIDKSKENQELKNQVKQLKKIGKFQQKGLIELGNASYLATVAENQRLKVENLKIKLKLDQKQRNHRLMSLSEKNQRFKKYQRQAESVKHAQQEQKKYNKQLTILKSIHQKDSNKLRQLVFEKNRNEEIIQNLTVKLQQKDKQIQGLKGTILNLRKIQKQSKKQKRYHTQANLESNQSKLNTSYSKKSQFIIKRELKKISNKKQQKSQAMSIQEHISEKQSPKQSQKHSDGGIFLTENSEKKGNSKQPNLKYPRLEQFGIRKQESQQWNDHPFRSKIKQIQILPHEDGHIKDVHVRYQNGQPNKKQGQYSAFICQQFNQYITKIRGGFKNQILQYLVVETNQKRTNKFCRYDIQAQCQNFSFNIGSNQYPSAFFGEKLNQGIIRLGCFIQKVGHI